MGARAGGSGGGGDMASSSVCGANGPFGTYTVQGGQSGVTACGHPFTSFTGATLTLTSNGMGGGLLTVTGTGDIGDTMNCPATITECNVKANACPSGSSSSVTYALRTYTFQLTGTASPSIPGAGGGCQFTYSVEGMR